MPVQVLCTIIFRFSRAHHGMHNGNDIVRVQLPFKPIVNYMLAICGVGADTKRFEGIDSEFKELMKEAINVPMAVDACGVDGRAEGLKSMMQRLDMCQKSLNEYLDMKKKVRTRR